MLQREKRMQRKKWKVAAKRNNIREKKKRLVYNVFKRGD